MERCLSNLEIWTRLVRSINVRIMFAVRHERAAGKQLQPFGGPWPFSHMRILANGQALK